MHIKICGITRLEDALLAAELGASALGFVFWPGSPRFIDPSRARVLVNRLPPFITTVGVFVDQPVDFVESVANLVGLGAIQLHGEESVSGYRGLKPPLIKALSGRNFQAERVADVPADVTLLLDSHDPVTVGGTGKTIDWTVAAEIARARRTILSGGLRAENVAAAIETVHPYAVDVSSGVEQAPGVKDSGRLRRFMAAVLDVRSADVAKS